jgi:hypothetical protein
MLVSAAQAAVSAATLTLYGCLARHRYCRAGGRAQAQAIVSFAAERAQDEPWPQAAVHKRLSEPAKKRRAGSRSDDSCEAKRGVRCGVVRLKNTGFAVAGMSYTQPRAAPTCARSRGKAPQPTRMPASAAHLLNVRSTTKLGYRWTHLGWGRRPK